MHVADGYGVATCHHELKGLGRFSPNWDINLSACIRSSPCGMSRLAWNSKIVDHVTAVVLLLVYASRRGTCYSHCTVVYYRDDRTIRIAD